MTDLIDRALGIHAQALALREKRAEILSANLANADTPNYKARDLNFTETLAAIESRLAGPDATAATAGAFAEYQDPQAGVTPELMYRVPSQSSIDGNTVETQKEHAEFMDNAIRYQASLTVLSGRIRSLLAAIRGE